MNLKTTSQKWAPLFYDFMSRLTIHSKETGVGPLRPYGAQRKFVDEVCEGLDRGIRTFMCLKARQLGVGWQHRHRWRERERWLRESERRRRGR